MDHLRSELYEEVEIDIFDSNSHMVWFEIEYLQKGGR